MSGAGAVEIWRGGVNPWECDEMGHMNVRFYLSHAMEGLAGLARHLGQPDAFARQARATLLVREHHIRFLREARSGAALHMTGGVAEFGDADALLVQLMFHEDGQPCASFLTRVTHATALERRPFSWPARAAEAAERLRMVPPDFAGARSLSGDPCGGEPTLARADRLGLRCIARGAVTADHCDVFGRMAVERVMARFSDGMGGFFRPIRRTVAGATGVTRVGGAALEFRLRYSDLPPAGAHLELRSAISVIEEKVIGVVHWLLDPVSGLPWATAEAVVATLDLDARKLIPLTSELQERLAEHVTPGLSRA